MHRRSLRTQKWDSILRLGTGQISTSPSRRASNRCIRPSLERSLDTNPCCRLGTGQIFDWRQVKYQRSPSRRASDRCIRPSLERSLGNSSIGDRSNEPLLGTRTPAGDRYNIRLRSGLPMLSFPTSKVKLVSAWSLYPFRNLRISDLSPSRARWGQVQWSDHCWDPAPRRGNVGAGSRVQDDISNTENSLPGGRSNVVGIWLSRLRHSPHLTGIGLSLKGVNIGLID